MPITKSAKKALRQNEKRKGKNLRRKREIKKLQKSLRILISQQKTKEAEKLLPQIYKAVDKAAKTQVIKKNKAAREKSKAVRLLNRELKEK